MNTTIPTPFDIIDPGPGALLPTGLAWLVLLACMALALIVFALLQRRPRSLGIRRTVRRLLDELNTATAHVSSQQDIERVTRIARRIASLYSTIEVGPMSPTEIRLFADSLSQHADHATRALSPVLLLLSDLEERAYAPCNSLAEDHTLHETLQKLRSNLEEHVTRFQPL
jgi:hypothetical protein